MWSMPEAPGLGSVVAAAAEGPPEPDAQPPATPATTRPPAAAADVVRNCLRERATSGFNDRRYSEVMILMSRALPTSPRNIGVGVVVGLGSCGSPVEG